MTSCRVRPKPRWVDGRKSEFRAKKRYIANVIRVSLVTVCFVFLVLCSINWKSTKTTEYQGSLYSSRHLLVATTGEPENSTASHHEVPWKGCQFENDMGDVRYAWAVFYLLLVLVTFIALAIICDDFFVPSLEVISEKLELSEDVAGATFMAAGSSAPELFTSVAGVAQETDVGVGTIVGSAVFNILIIIALSAALAGQVLNLDWRPLTRDSVYYALSIACFIGFTWDARIQLWEAIVLLVLYILYIVLMKFNKHLMELLGKCTCACCARQVVPIDAESGQEVETDTTNVPGEETASKKLDGDNNIPNDSDTLPPLKKDRRLSVVSIASTGSGSKHIFHHVKHGELSGKIANKRPSIAVTHFELTNLDIKQADKEDNNTQPSQKDSKDKDDAGSKTEEEEEEPQIVLCSCMPALAMGFPDREEARQGGCCGWIKYVFKWILFVVSFPFVVLFTWTIPNCGKPHLRRWFIVSFIMSVVWIAVVSFAMVTLVQRTGCILGVDEFTMGLVIVAIGTSVPDALSSILVARDGFGDMAVSNAIGSNVFDINLGLGLPFVITIAIKEGSSLYLFLGNDELHEAYVNGEMLLTPHAKFGFILLLILVLTLIVFGAARFRLTMGIGISFALMYVVFLIYAFIQEFVCDGYKC
ncbi:sodium/potassium/calcium exchanger 4-like isoform X2 [Glandiceps talaboti]